MEEIFWHNRNWP